MEAEEVLRSTLGGCLRNRPHPKPGTFWCISLAKALWERASDVDNYLRKSNVRLKKFGGEGWTFSSKALRALVEAVNLPFNVSTS